MSTQVVVFAAGDQHLLLGLSTKHHILLVRGCLIGPISPRLVVLVFGTVRGLLLDVLGGGVVRHVKQHGPGEVGLPGGSSLASLAGCVGQWGCQGCRQVYLAVVLAGGP